MRGHSTVRSAWAPLVVGLCIALFPPLGARPAAAAAPQCGKERWSVKTGTDPGAGAADLTSPKPTTIADLLMLPKPPHWSNDLPRESPVETTLWVITGLLT